MLLISSNGPGGDHVCELHMGGGEGGRVRGSEVVCDGVSVPVRCEETVPVQGGGSLLGSWETPLVGRSLGPLGTT